VDQAQVVEMVFLPVLFRESGQGTFVVKHASASAPLTWRTTYADVRSALRHSYDFEVPLQLPICHRA
jgi:hypothetical protein